MRFDDLGRGLDELDQDPRAADRESVIALGVDEADIMTRCTFSQAPGREAYTAGSQPCRRALEVVDPQTKVVERRDVHRRAGGWINRLHEIDLGPMRANPGDRDLLVDVLGLAAEVSDRGEAQQVDPEMTKLQTVQVPDRDLLNAEHPKRSIRHGKMEVAPTRACPRAPASDGGRIRRATTVAQLGGSSQPM